MLQLEVQKATYKSLTTSIFALIFTHCWTMVVCGEKLALLSATLRTYQKIACDTDQVVIACPRGTSISIELAQYNNLVNKGSINLEKFCTLYNKDIANGGKVNNSMSFSSLINNSNASARLHFNSTSRLFENINSFNTSGNHNHTVDINPTNNCVWSSALQTVVEACQKKKHCKIGGRLVSHKTEVTTVAIIEDGAKNSELLNNNLCFDKRKLVEVAYKCRPYEFRSKVACSNEVAQLECNPNARIAIYSASFGRTEYESIQCPQPQGVREETCLANYVTETVMQICHGRRRCNLAADPNTFGSPCRPNTRMYLKIIYTCVPKQVLTDYYDSEIETETDADAEIAGIAADINNLYSDDFYKESEAIPKLFSNTTTPSIRSDIKNNSTGTPTESYISAVITSNRSTNFSDDHGRLFFYLLTTGFIAVVLCVVTIIIRVIALRNDVAQSSVKLDIVSKDTAVNNSSSSVSDANLSHSFNEAISVVDTNIELACTTNAMVNFTKNKDAKNKDYDSSATTTTTTTTTAMTNAYQTFNECLGQSNICSIPSAFVENINANVVACKNHSSPDILGNSATYYSPTSNLNAPTSTAIIISATNASNYNTCNDNLVVSFADYATASAALTDKLNCSTTAFPQNFVHHQQNQEYGLHSVPPLCRRHPH